jgi:hypothetical protein
MPRVENPWLKLPSQSPYVLEIDRVSISQYNQLHGEDRKININSVPEPFIGNPESAKLILLSLNPGDSKHDVKAHLDDEFKKAMFHTLHRESQDWPFYSLNPAFSWTGAGKWWAPRTRELQLSAGLDYATLAKRLLVIEWFPYHSKKSALPTNPVCESQKYSFQLAKEMLEKKRLVVGMRSRNHWAEVDERFREAPFLKNPQCGYVSRGNTEGDLFDRMVEALKSCGCTQPAKR